MTTNWLGLASMTSNQVCNVVTNYETHGLDLVTGQPTTSAGGYAKLHSLAGYAPFMVGIASDASLNGPVQTAFNKQGAWINVVHGTAKNLTNKTVRGMYEKPEHVDLRLFETNYDGVASGVILSNVFQWARSSNGVAPPCFTGVKMHDNDFFASNSAWVTIYEHKTNPHARLARPVRRTGHGGRGAFSPIDGNRTRRLFARAAHPHRQAKRAITGETNRGAAKTHGGLKCFPCPFARNVW